MYVPHIPYLPRMIIRIALRMRSICNPRAQHRAIRLQEPSTVMITTSSIAHPLNTRDGRCKTAPTACNFACASCLAARCLCALWYSVILCAACFATNVFCGTQVEFTVSQLSIYRPYPVALTAKTPNLFGACAIHPSLHPMPNSLSPWLPIYNVASSLCHFS